MNLKIIEKFANFLLALKKYHEYKKKSKSFNKLPNKKSLVIKIRYPYNYHRYFYLLLKYYSLAGYSVYFPHFNFKYFRTKIWYRREMEVQQYFDLIFKDGLINIGAEPPSNSIIKEFNENNVSVDYFYNFYYKDVNKKFFHVPITMHPNMYHNYWWNKSIETSHPRKNTVYTYGNLNSENYLGFDSEIFKMSNRLSLVDYVVKQKDVVYKTKVEDIHSYINGNKVLRYLLFDGASERIPMQDIRYLLSNFNYFLATPGVVIPQCHNLVEALSVGTIPIIDINYSRVLIPELKHMHNAIIYEGLEDLPAKVDIALSLNDDEIKEIRDNTLAYYQGYLTPESVVRNIEESQPTVLYLLAEHLSVNILKDKISL